MNIYFISMVYHLSFASWATVSSFIVYLPIYFPCDCSSPSRSHQRNFYSTVFQIYFNWHELHSQVQHITLILNCLLILFCLGFEPSMIPYVIDNFAMITNWIRWDLNHQWKLSLDLKMRALPTALCSYVNGRVIE